MDIPFRGRKNGIEIYSMHPGKKEEDISKLTETESWFSDPNKLKPYETDLDLFIGDHRPDVNSGSTYEFEKAGRELKSNNKVMMFDYETIGTPPKMNRTPNSKEFSPVEFAFAQTRFTKDGLKDAGVKGSVLIQPHKAMIEEAQNLINKIKTDPFLLSNGSLDDSESLTVKRLFSYGNAKTSTQTHKGMSYTSLDRTGHAPTRTSAIGVKGIEEIQKGLDLLKNATPIDNFADIFLDTMNKGRAGHNVVNFDDNVTAHIANILEQMGGKKEKKKADKIRKTLLNPVIDTLQVQKLVPKPYSTFGRDQKLGNSLYSKTGKLLGEAHTAIFDVMANIDLANESIPEALAAIPKLRPEGLKNGDTLYVTRGTQTYRDTPNAGYNGHRRERDVKLVLDENGNYVRSRNGREATVTGGSAYRIAGQYDQVPFGKDNELHSMMVLDNIDTGDRSVIVGSSRGEIASILQERNVRKKINPREEAILKRDRGRRRLDYILNPSQSEFKIDTVKELSTAYKDIDRFKAEVLKTGAKTDKEKNIIMKKLFEEKAAGQKTSDPKYRLSFEKYRSTIEVSDAFEEIRQFAAHSSKTATSLFQDDVQKRNAFMESMFGKYKNTVGLSIHETQERAGLFLPINGKDSTEYFDVANPESIQRKIYGQVSNKNKTAAMTSLDSFLSDLTHSGGISVTDKNKYMAAANKELREAGTLSKSLVTEISEVIQETVKGSGKSIEFATVTKDKKSVDKSAFSAGLSKKGSESRELFDSWASSTEKEVNDRILSAGQYNQQQAHITKEMLEESGLKTHYNIEDRFNKILQSGQSTHAVQMKQPSYHESLNEMLEGLTRGGFETKVIMNKDSNKLFAYVGRTGTVSKRTENELIKSKSVGRIELPTFGEDNTVSFNGVKYQNRFYHKGLVKGEYNVSNLPNEILAQLKNLGVHLDEKFEDIANLGMKTDGFQSVLDKVINAKTYGLRETLSEKAYLMDRNSDPLEIKTSRSANLKAGSQIDISGVSNEMLSETNPKMYEAFLKIKEENPIYQKWEDVPLFKWKQYRADVSKESLADMKMRSSFEIKDFFNERYGKHVGVEVTPNGVSANNYFRGILSTNDVRNLSFGGQFQKTGQERVEKALNYAPLNREQLVKDLMNNRGISKERAEAMAGPRNQTEMTVNAGGLEETSHINLNQKIMNDVQLNNSLEELKVKHKKAADELDNLHRNAGTNPSIDLEIERKTKEVSQMERVIRELDGASTYDGQIIMRQSVADSLTRVQKGNIKTENLPVDTKFVEFLKENNHIPKDFDFNSSFDFETPVHAKDLGRAGLLDKDGQITVGSLTKEMTTKSRIRQKDYQITGYDNVNKSFKYEAKVKTVSGRKVITPTGLRATVSVISDEAMDAVTHSGIDIIGPTAGMSKGAGGILQLQQIDTLGRKVQSQLLDLTEGKTSIDQLSPKLREIIKSKKMDSFDTLKTPQMQTAIVNESLNTLRESLSIKDGLNYQASENGMTLIENLPNDSVIGNAKQSILFGQTLDKEANLLGVKLKADEIVEQVGLHDVFVYGGSDTKVDYSSKEFNAIRNNMYQAGVDVRDIDTYLATIQTPTLADDLWKKEATIELSNQLHGYDQARTVFGKRNIDRPGVAILDMTGGYEGNTSAIPSTSPSQFSENGALIIDYSQSQKKTPRERALGSRDAYTYDDTFNTAMSPRSILVTNDGEKETVGSIMERMVKNQETSSPEMYLKVPELKGKSLSLNSEPLPLIDLNPNPMVLMDRDQRMHLNDIQDTQALFYEKVSQMQNQTTPITDKQIQQANDIREELLEKQNRFTTGTGAGGKEKGLLGVHQEMSGTYRLQTRNVAASYSTDAGEAILTSKKIESSVMISSSEFEKLVKGKERNIAIAMGLDKEISIGDINKMSAEELVETMKARIHYKAENPLELNAVVGRQPTTSKDVLPVRSLLLNDDLGYGADSVATLGPATAKQAHADFDGDNGGVSLNQYNSNDDDTIRKNRVVDQKVKEAQIKKLQEDGYAGKVVSNEIFNGEGSPVTIGDLYTQMDDKDAFFAVSPSTRSKAEDEMLTVISMNQKRGIGPANNFIARQNQAASLVTDSLFKSGRIDAAKQSEILNDIDAFGNVFAQIPIGTKHVEKTLNVVPGPETIENYISYTKGTQSAMDSIHELIYGDRRSVRDASNLIREVIPEEQLNSIISHSTSGTLEGIMENFALVNNTFARTDGGANGYHGKTGTADTYYKSPLAAPTEQSKIFNSSNPELIHAQEENFDRFARQTFDKGSAVDMKDAFNDGYNFEGETRKINSTSRQFTQTNIDAFEDYISSGKGKQALDSTAQTVDELAENITKKIKSNKVGIKEGLKAGAIFASMWGLSAMGRREPTPEGAEAQQEATATQVNPSLLLTSPTARVTPNSENISLKVRANGGSLSQEELASLINQQVSQMAGVSMNMNVNVNDNTQKLDSKWFETHINNAMGFQ